MDAEGMDRALDQLEAALARQGLPALGSPSDPYALFAIDEEIAPLVLPGDLRRFWTRVEPSSLAPLGIFPSFISAACALDTYRGLRAWDQPQLFGPPLLFPVAYSSQCFRTVELASSWHEGGCVFYWVNDGTEGFRLQYRSLTDLIVAVAELIDADAVDHRSEYDGRPYVSIDTEAEEHKQAVGLLIAGSHPIYGEAVSVANDVETWPSHWLASAGIDVADRSPRGATHTIADALSEAEGGPLQARIAGVVTRLVGTGNGVRVLVDDGTGVVDVSCPHGTGSWVPAMRQLYEFDVVFERPPGPLPEYDRWHREIQAHAVNARHEQAVAATTELERQMRERPAQAVATDIHPIAG